MSRYAEGTTVSIEGSQRDIRQTLKRYYADHITLYENEAGYFGVQFSLHGCVLRVGMQTPPLEEFARDGRGRRNPAAQAQAREREQVRLWRVLLLVIKAKLEMTEDEGLDFQTEMLGWLVLNTGETVAEAMKPRIAAAQTAGVMPTGEMFRKLLPGPTNGEKRA